MMKCKIPVGIVGTQAVNSNATLGNVQKQGIIAVARTEKSNGVMNRYTASLVDDKQ